MKFYCFGDEEKPVILLLPGTCCHWKRNFGHMLPLLERDFHVVYRRHFKTPDIRQHDMQHEELLVRDPEQWTAEVRRCCGMEGKETKWH